MTDVTPKHYAVISNLAAALNNLQRAVGVADIRASLAAANTINQALDQAHAAQQVYTAWSLSDRK